jgi:alkaline phosphatase D
MREMEDAESMASEIRRREFLRLAAAGFLAGYVLRPTEILRAQSEPFAINATLAPESVFGFSVASGDPNPTGVILWTRINPGVVQSGSPVGIEIAADTSFTQSLLRLEIPASEVTPALDYTLRVDLSGHLQSNSIYYYRFIYRSVASKTGRCRTLPRENETIAKLKFAVINCMDYTDGYYPAFNYIADDPSIDFALHLGDFIYETTGGTSFKSNPFPDRTITLPSGSDVALNLADYRALYQTYRRDPFLQKALENFTWLVTWDDHEMANDQYHDYANNSAGAPDHPYTTDPAYQANSVSLLRQLKFDSQQAWFEYNAARVKFDAEGTDIFERLSIYRKFRFGRLVELFLTDERTYRSPHPEGETEFGERYFAVSDARQRDPNQTMLGQVQRDTFIHDVAASTSLWKAWANEVLLGALQVLITPDLLGKLPTSRIGLLTADNDAWDGYQYERQFIASALKQAGVSNLVVLTGDLHTYLAGHFKKDFNQLLNIDPINLVGVEYMTPAMTSSNFQEQFNLPSDLEALLEDLVLVNNPHIKYFNSHQHGYATVEFNLQYCQYVMYSVDKTQNSSSATRSVVKQFLTPVGTVRILDVTPAGQFRIPT